MLLALVCFLCFEQVDFMSHRIPALILTGGRICLVALAAGFFHLFLCKAQTSKCPKKPVFCILALHKASSGYNCRQLLLLFLSCRDLVISN